MSTLPAGTGVAPHDRREAWYAGRRRLARLGHVLVLASFVAFLAFPFYWMALTTFKQTADLVDIAHNPLLFTMPPTLENLRVLFRDTLFVQWILNTLQVGILVTLVTLALAVPAGYALARLSGRWGQAMAIGIFLTYLIPPTILFIPFSRIIGRQCGHERETV